MVASDGTLDDLLAAIWKLRDVGWRDDHRLDVWALGDGSWVMRLGSMQHYGQDVADAASGLYQEMRDKAEREFRKRQDGADSWRKACDFPVPEWAWPKGWKAPARESEE